jgi:hypothetical protein
MGWNKLRSASHYATQPVWKYKRPKQKMDNMRKNEQTSMKKTNTGTWKQNIEWMIINMVKWIQVKNDRIRKGNDNQNDKMKK